MTPRKPAAIVVNGRIEHRNISSRGGSRAWTKLRDQVVREEPICRLRLNGCTIRSQTADHVIPRKIRPDLAMRRENLRGACHSCNRRRGTRSQRQLEPLRKTQQPAPALKFFEKG